MLGNKELVFELHTEYVGILNLHLRSAFFWVITQRIVIISYRCFGTTYETREP